MFITGEKSPKIRVISVITLVLILVVEMGVTGCTPGFHLSSYSEAELLQEAENAVLEKGRETAIVALTEILKRQPEHPAALLFRARLAYESNENPLALTLLQKIGNEHRRIASKARFIEGAIAMESHQGRKADHLLGLSMRLDPSNVSPRERLVKLYALQRRREDLLRELSEIEGIRPLKLTELALVVTANDQIWNAQDAVVELQKMLANDPADLASQYALGLYYKSELRMPEAISVFEAVLLKDPTHSLAHVTLAQMCLDQLDIAGATRHLSSLTLSPESPAEVWAAFGFYFVARSESKFAAGCLSEAIKRNPFDRASYVQLGGVLRVIDETSDAERMLLQAKALDDFRHTMDNVGHDYVAGKTKAAELVRVAQFLLDLEEVRQSEAWNRLAVEYDDHQTVSHKVVIRKHHEKSLEEIIAKYRPQSIPSIDGSIPIPDHRLESNPEIIAPQLTFVDEFASRGLHFQYENGASGRKYIIETLGGGVGVIDYDGDNWPDVVFPQGGSIPLRNAPRDAVSLFRNEFGVSFSEVGAIPAITCDEWYGAGIAVGDLNNDGYDDLVIGNVGGNIVLQNQGDGTFLNITDRTGINVVEMTSSIGLADLDQDGLLDIFVVNYVDSLKTCRNPQGQAITCHPGLYNGVTDRVYRNLGDGRFADDSAKCGIAPRGKGLGIVLADLDDDGKIDAFVANDTSPNHLYLNESRPGEIRLRETGLLAGVAVGENGNLQAGMGIACGDFNNDLRLDLYVTYFHREANGLYLNEGMGLFKEATRVSGLYEPTYHLLGFGTQAIDCDGDGSLELFVANGHVDDLVQEGVAWKMPPQLFWREPSGRYQEVSSTAGSFFKAPALGRAVAKLDWNWDGRTDLVVNHLDRPTALLKNETVAMGNSLKLLLHGVRSNRNAIGASVVVRHRRGAQRADVTGGDGYRCTNSRWLTLGLGDLEVADEVEIRWPSGGVEKFINVATDQPWLVIETRGLVPLRRPCEL